MLTHQDIRLLEFEERNPQHTPAKVDAIRNRIGMSPSRYYEHLERLARRPEVEGAYPRVAARVERRLAARHDRERFRRAA
ncbi:MAG: DUF3263 domain-containing protein [Amnibacterium sp.]